MLTVTNLTVPAAVHSIHIGLLIIELILISNTAFVVLMAGYIVLYRYRQFHVHLMMIVSIFYLAFFVVSIPRAIIIIKYFCHGADGYEINDEFDVYMDSVRTIGGSVALITAPVLVAERVFATIFIKSYEHMSNWIFLCFVILSMWIGCFGFIYMIVFYDWSIILIVIVVLILLVSAYIILLRLYKWSCKEYEKKDNKYSLSVRFQLSENIRFAHILVSFFKGYFIGGALVLLLMGLVKEVPILVTYPIIILFLYHLYELIIALAAIAMVGGTVYSDPLWRRSFYNLSSNLIRCKIKRIKATENPPPSISILSMHGKALVFDGAAASSEHYFNTLSNMWK